MQTLQQNSMTNDIQSLVDKYYPEGTLAREKYIPHVQAVTDAVAKIIQHNPDLEVDIQLALNGAYLHDIGICMTNVESLGCYGTAPYIQHGVLGRDILIKEGFGQYAMICERHVGTGLDKDFADANNFPEPHRDMKPETIEEILVCYADSFFSKSSDDLTKPEPLELIRSKIAKHGEEGMTTFDNWCKQFGTDYLYE